MLFAIIALWFVMSLVVLCYGASNNAVAHLGWPRWSTPAIMGAGCLMFVAMFVAMGASVVTDVPGDWHVKSLHTEGGSSGD
jgi:hypothetical protein